MSIMSLLRLNMRIQQAIKKCKCEDCGEIFFEDEADYERVREDRGEYWGQPCYEDVTYMHCPNCYSECINDYYEDDEDDETDGE